MYLKKLKIITWNVNSVRIRKEQVENLASEEEPDFIFLQETKVSDYEGVEGYQLYHAGGIKGRNGVAILAKEKADKIEYDDNSRIVHLKYGNVNFFSIYAPNGFSTFSTLEHKIEFFQNLKIKTDEMIQNGETVIMGGDFNVIYRKHEINIPDPYTDYEKSVFKSLLLNLNDTTPNSGLYLTWWDYRHFGFDRNLGIGLDRYLLSKNIEYSNLGILRSYRKLERPADHAPVRVEIYINK